MEIPVDITSIPSGLWDLQSDLLKVHPPPLPGGGSQHLHAGPGAAEDPGSDHGRPAFHGLPGPACDGDARGHPPGRYRLGGRGRVDPGPVQTLHTFPVMRQLAPGW